MSDWLRRGVDGQQPMQEPLFTAPENRKGKQDIPNARPYQNMAVFEPKNNQDIQDLIDFLKRREPVIVNLNQVDVNAAQRMLDFIAGAVYALNGNVHNVSAKIYLLAPDGVNISAQG